MLFYLAACPLGSLMLVSQTWSTLEASRCISNIPETPTCNNKVCNKNWTLANLSLKPIQDLKLNTQRGKVRLDGQSKKLHF